jgi:ATP-dependent helicase HrpA
MPADVPEPDATAFPTTMELENRALPLAYAYKPGGEDDGVTLQVSVREAATLSEADLDWAVPGHLEAKVEHLLRSLPKDLRRAFAPLSETARSLSTSLADRRRLTEQHERLVESLATALHERFGISLKAESWGGKSLPDHLRVRVRVVDDEGREICAGRDLDSLRETIRLAQDEASLAAPQAETDAWKRACRKWERPDQTSWTFGDLPERIEICDRAGVPVFGYPALRASAGGVSLRLFQSAADAAVAMRTGVARLLELQLRHELGWLERDLRDLRSLGPELATLAPVASVQADALEGIWRWVVDPSRVLDREQTGARGDAAIPTAAFESALKESREALQGLVPRLTDLLREILTLRQKLQVHPSPYPSLERDLAELVPPDLLRQTAYPQLTHFPRYLRARLQRADRWKRNPEKDAERDKQLGSFRKSLAGLEKDATGGRLRDLRTLRWMIHEFHVSLFAQELGTALPVSAARIERFIADIRAGKPVTTPVAPPPAVHQPQAQVRTPVPASGKREAPIKNLAALDRLFRK